MVGKRIRISIIINYEKDNMLQQPLLSHLIASDRLHRQQQQQQQQSQKVIPTYEKMGGSSSLLLGEDLLLLPPGSRRPTMVISHRNIVSHRHHPRQGRGT
mmetsp:Transcript_23903/g.24172  ORF Transcript_23903/g.24172 Transcript_23903/m.24172 type:complete len:100 (+) Transcript_23903:126-425(+)